MTKKIVIDAGHGSQIIGNQTPDGIDEWTLNNEVALLVEKYLSAYDVDIHRVDDVTGVDDVALALRVDRVNRLMPDAFVSIHHNAYNSKWGNHSGVEVFYNLNRRNDAEKQLASDISAKISEHTGITNRGIKTAAFHILTVDLNILAILTEGGFMDSLIDNPIITSKKGQQGYAKAISQGLINQLKLVKKKNVKEADVSLKIDDSYVVRNVIKGYHTLADAQAARHACIAVAAGVYWIFDVKNKMVNITKSKGHCGIWIHHEQNVSDHDLKKLAHTFDEDALFHLKKHLPGYDTAIDAQNKENQRLTVLAGKYVIKEVKDGIIQIAKMKDSPGVWVNLK